MSVDAPDLAARLVAEERLPFAVLSDPGGHVVRAYGLEHEGGGPQGETIAVPAQLLVRQDGTIAWRHVARSITDRVDPARTIEAIEDL